MSILSHDQSTFFLTVRFLSVCMLAYLHLFCMLFSPQRLLAMSVFVPLRVSIDRKFKRAGSPDANVCLFIHAAKKVWPEEVWKRCTDWGKKSERDSEQNFHLGGGSYRGFVRLSGSPLVPVLLVYGYFGGVSASWRWAYTPVGSVYLFFGRGNIYFFLFLPWVGFPQKDRQSARSYHHGESPIQILKGVNLVLSQE